MNQLARGWATHSRRNFGKRKAIIPSALELALSGEHGILVNRNITTTQRQGH